MDKEEKFNQDGRKNMLLIGMLTGRKENASCQKEGQKLIERCYEHTHSRY